MQSTGKDNSGMFTTAKLRVSVFLYRASDKRNMYVSNTDCIPMNISTFFFLF